MKDKNKKKSFFKTQGNYFINEMGELEKQNLVQIGKHLEHPVFSIISEISSVDQTEVFVIGGFVRDLLLNRPSKDIDVVVVGSGIELAKKTAQLLNIKNVNIFKNYGTAMIQYQDHVIEFVGARKESYREESRKPLVETGSLEDDQKRRDFTINAMAISLNKENYGEFIDPFGGLKDLENKTIKTPLSPGITFSDDPLRMFRAIRFATQLQFRIEENTLKAINENKDRVNILSAERIADEVNKMLLSSSPSIGFQLMESTGLLKIILPEVDELKGVETKEGKGHKDNFYHSLAVLDKLSNVSGNLWTRWAALLHDIGKPVTKKFIKGQGWTFHGHDFIGSKMIVDIFRRLRLPLGPKMKYVQKLVALHLRPIVLSQEEVTDSAVRRLLFEAGDDIDDLMDLCEADITSKNPNTVRKHLANFKKVREKLKDLEEKDRVRNFQPPVQGEEIMRIFNLPPSKEIGIIKMAIKDAILDGVISNDKEEAINYMLKKGKELGLKPLDSYEK